MIDPFFKVGILSGLNPLVEFPLAVLMPNPKSATQDAARAFEHVATLEREIAELRQQLAILSSQDSERLVLAPSDEQESLYAEARYRALIEMTPLAVWITDTKGRTVYGNRYWHEFSSMTMEQSAGWGWMNALHPDDVTRVKAEWGGRTTPYEAELRYRRGGDGQYRWHLCRTLPLKDADGKITKWLGILVDIHDRKTAEAAIAEANQRMLLAVEAAEAGTWDYFPKTGKTECSERWHKIFHIPLGSDNSQEAFFSRIHPKDRPRIRDLIQRAMDPQIAEDFDVDYRIVWPDGTVRWLLAKGKSFFSGEGPEREAVRFTGIVVDITKREEVEQERARLTAAVQNSPDFIGITDLKGRVLFLNRAGQKMVGLRNDGDARSKTAIDFLGPEERSILEQEILPLVLSGQVWEGEFSMRHFVTGEPILVETRVFGVFDETGRPTSMANLSRDISEKKKLEEQLRGAQRMEAIGRLAGGIAHDFNNLLTIIRGAGEILEERLLGDAPNLQVVTEIHDAAERASVLTQQLLTFGRRQMVRPRPIDLNKVILRMQDMLQRLAGEDITLETQLQEDLWNVTMDPIQVDQILINLAANARDAMPQGGAITMRTFNWQASQPAKTPAGLKPGPYACLSFSDNGCGMEPETLSHIFEPFFTTKELGKGTGLGLSTVYGVVHQNDGQISVRSTPGEGTSFTFYLPRATENASPEASSQKPKSLPGAGNILLVEDERSLRAMVSGYVRESGYQVYEAADANEALRISQDHSIDLLLTDIVMPGASGTALASTLKASRPQMRVIFMSGYAEHAALQEAMLKPNTLFLQKPFRLSALVAKIHQALADAEPAQKQ